MVRIAPITMQYNPKVLWFDPNGIEIHEGDRVIVSTERGTEFGIASDIREVSEEAVSNLPELKPVLRIATEEDIAHNEEMRALGEQALPIFKQMALETNPDMHPVMVEYLFDGDKAVFYFESEDRIDFRDLVRQLAAEFHIRVDMRQIGVRDEARLVGGLGHCGQELCCRRLGGEICPVSIRMAKEQDLSLNPQKISGVCGRLMCCLRYEFDAYKEFKSRAPKLNAKIQTPAGVAKVVDLDMPRETVRLRLEEDGKTVTVPLSAMDEAPEGATRPNSIGEAFEEYANSNSLEASVAGLFNTSTFTRDDKLATPQAHHRGPSKANEDSPTSESALAGSSRRRRRSRQVETGTGGVSTKPDTDKKHTAAEGESASKRKRQNRRHQRHVVPNDIATEQAQSQTKSKQRKEKVQNQKTQIQRKRSGARPGQRSSGIRAERNQQVASKQPAVKSERSTNARGNGNTSADTSQTQQQHRRSRRRSHKSGGDTHES